MVGSGSSDFLDSIVQRDCAPVIVGYRVPQLAKGFEGIPQRSALRCSGGRAAETWTKAMRRDF